MRVRGGSGIRPHDSLKALPNSHGSVQITRSLVSMTTEAWLMNVMRIRSGPFVSGFVVRKRGFEPLRFCSRQPLKLVRLPFRHFRVGMNLQYMTGQRKRVISPAVENAGRPAR